MNNFEDIKILSICANIPGPLACQRLAEMGAQVTRIVSPSGDALNLAAPQWYHDIHSKQKVISLDLLKQYSEFQELLKTAHLLMTSSRPASLHKLNLSYDILKKNHPRLCQIDIVGFERPRENEPSHDLTCQATAGLLVPGQMPRVLAADFLVSERVVSRAIELVYKSQISKKGLHHVETLESAARHLALPVQYGLTASSGPLSGSLPGYGLYNTKSGWIAVGCLEAHFLEKLKNELKIPQVTRDNLEASFKLQTADYWESWASKRELPICKLS